MHDAFLFEQHLCVCQLMFSLEFAVAIQRELLSYICDGTSFVLAVVFQLSATVARNGFINDVVE